MRDSALYRRTTLGPDSAPIAANARATDGRVLGSPVAGAGVSAPAAHGSDDGRCSGGCLAIAQAGDHNDFTTRRAM